MRIQEIKLRAFSRPVMEKKIDKIYILTRHMYSACDSKKLRLQGIELRVSVIFKFSHNEQRNWQHAHTNAPQL